MSVKRSMALIIYPQLKINIKTQKIKIKNNNNHEVVK